jgi:hypothetical protein
VISVLGKPLASLFDRAAAGDADAQSGLVQYSLDRIREGAVTFQHGVCVAEAFARMAAVHRRPADLMCLAGVLMYAAQVASDRGDAEDSMAHQAEAIAVLSDLADQGDEDAALAVQEVSAVLSPPAIIRAADLLRANRAQSGCKGAI